MNEIHDYYQSPRDADVAHRGPSGLPFCCALLVAMVAGPLGGLLCGIAISRFGEFGSISLWAYGALVGYIARKLLDRPSRLIGGLLVAGCVISFVIAEVCWLHWNTQQGADGWLDAMLLLPAFVEQYTVAALLGTIFTGLGAWSAYRRVAEP